MLTLFFRAEADDERTDRLPQLAVRLGFASGASAEKMVAQGRVETHGEHQVGLVAKMMVERAFGDFRRARDVARSNAAQPLRAQQPLGRGDELLLLVDRRRMGIDAGCSGPGHAGSGLGKSSN